MVQAERPFDGVVAYWDSDNATASTNFNNIYTYFPDADGKGPRVDINAYAPPAPTPPYNKLTPFFLPPEQIIGGPGMPYSKALTSQLMIKTLLIDPYTPIHLYPSILPINSLQLPAWTMKDAMKNMSECIFPFLSAEADKTVLQPLSSLWDRFW